MHKLHRFNVLNTYYLFFCNCACTNWTIQLLCICGNDFVFLFDSISQVFFLFICKFISLSIFSSLKFVLQFVFLCNCINRRIFFPLFTKHIKSVRYWILREEAFRWRMAKQIDSFSKAQSVRFGRHMPWRNFNVNISCQISLGKRVNKCG